MLRFPSGCCAENRLKEDRETSEEVIIQARAMKAAQTPGGNGGGEKQSDSGHVLQAGTTGFPDRVDMEHARKSGTKDAFNVWGLMAGRVGVPFPETGQLLVEHMWGKQRALRCGRPHGGRESTLGCGHLGTGGAGRACGEDVGVAVNQVGPSR